MLPPDLYNLLRTMTMGSKLVSKRNGHPFIEDGVSKESSDCLPKRAMKYDEPITMTEKGVRRTSTSTATSQSSITSDGGSSSCRTETSKETAEETSLETVKDVGEMLIPLDAIPTTGRPINFGVVVPGVYRSNYPQAEDYPFIEKLKLKTIVTLVQKELPEGYSPFINSQGIKHYVFDMKGTKKEEIPVKTMKAILRIILDQQNHPVLIHCNHGRHRTGCVVAIVRKVSGWDVGRIIDEYKSYAEPKIRDNDVKYITGFELSSLSNLFVKETNIQLRVRNFFRATCFTLFVLLLWLVSGKRLAGEQQKTNN